MAEAHKESERRGVTSFKAGTEAEEEQVLVTIKAPMGRVVKVEKIDKAGKHHEIAHEEWAKLVGGDEIDDIEDALEQAFEAGVAAVLGDRYEDEDVFEDDEEKGIRQALIAGLLHRRHRPLQGRILQRLVVSRLLHRRFATGAARQ